MPQDVYSLNIIRSVLLNFLRMTRLVLLPAYAHNEKESPRL